MQKADRKMVKALDKLHFNERQWGHWLARNAIDTMYDMYKYKRCQFNAEMNSMRRCLINIIEFHFGFRINEDITNIMLVMMDNVGVIYMKTIPNIECWEDYSAHIIF